MAGFIKSIALDIVPIIIVNQLYPLLSFAFVGVGQIKQVKITEFAVVIFIFI